MTGVYAKASISASSDASLRTATHTDTTKRCKNVDCVGNGSIHLHTTVLRYPLRRVVRPCAATLTLVETP